MQNNFPANGLLSRLLLILSNVPQQTKLHLSTVNWVGDHTRIIYVWKERIQVPSSADRAYSIQMFLRSKSENKYPGRTGIGKGKSCLILPFAVGILTEIFYWANFETLTAFSSFLCLLESALKDKICQFCETRTIIGDIDFLNSLMRHSWQSLFANRIVTRFQRSAGQASEAESQIIASFEAKVKEKENKKLERLQAEKKREQENLKSFSLAN